VQRIDSISLRVPSGFTREEAELILRRLGIAAIQCEWDDGVPILKLIEGKPPDDLDRARFRIYMEESCGIVSL